MKTIDELEREIWEKIQSATQGRDSGKIATFNNLAQELERVKREVMRIERIISEPQTPSPDGRFVEVEITEGALRQNYFPLTKLRERKLVPLDGKEFLIETSAGFSFRTTVSDNGNWLAARGKTGQFYRKSGMKPGDKVIWSETEPYKYRMIKK